MPHFTINKQPHPKPFVSFKNKTPRLQNLSEAKLGQLHISSGTQQQSSARHQSALGLQMLTPRSSLANRSDTSIPVATRAGSTNTQNKHSSRCKRGTSPVLLLGFASPIELVSKIRSTMPVATTRLLLNLLVCRQTRTRWTKNHISSSPKSDSVPSGTIVSETIVYKRTSLSSQTRKPQKNALLYRLVRRYQSVRSQRRESKDGTSSRLRDTIRRTWQMLHTRKETEVATEAGKLS